MLMSLRKMTIVTNKKDNNLKKNKKIKKDYRDRKAVIRNLLKIKCQHNEIIIEVIFYIYTYI